MRQWAGDGMPAPPPMAQLDNIRACVFDAYGTLYDFNSATERCRDALGDKAAPLSAEWRGKQLQYTWLRSLMGLYDPFWTVTGDALDYSMDSLGIDDPALRDRLMDLYRNLDAFPAATLCWKHRSRSTN